MLPTDLQNIVDEFAAARTKEQFEDEIHQLWYIEKNYELSLWLLDMVQLFLGGFKEGDIVTNFSLECDLQIWCIESLNFEIAVVSQGLSLYEHQMKKRWQVLEEELP